MSAAVSDPPKAENGIIHVGEWDAPHEALIRQRWPQAVIDHAAKHLTRIDLSNTERGACPGFNDFELLGDLSHAGGIVFGFFCDGVKGAEGVRVFERGRQRERLRVEWETAQPQDSIAWPIAALAMSLQVEISAVTRVTRPPRPSLTLAVEALLASQPAQSAELTYQALQILGDMEHPEATQALLRALKSEDWIERFHAARGYARLFRDQGQSGLPRLDTLLDDEDEGVREAALEGLAELIHHVEFSNREVHMQIDRSIKRGLADEDEDVRAAATKAQGLRTKLLG